MNLHKLFRQLFELPDKDSYEVFEFLEKVRDARTEFENTGTEFTYERFKQWFQKVYINRYNPPHPPYVKLLKIIEGDNLDIIEDAAEEKGLIPKEQDEEPK